MLLKCGHQIQFVLSFMLMSSICILLEAFKPYDHHICFSTVNFLITSLLFSRMLVRNLQLCFGLVVYHPPNLNCFSDLLNKQMARILIRWVWTQVHLQVLMLVGKVLWTYFPKHLTAHQVQKRKKLLLGEWQVWFC